MKSLLSLDMSTTCTGWSVLDMETKALIAYGTLKPSMKGGIAKLEYPLQQLTKMIDLAYQIRAVIENYKPEHIVIEEITGSKQRLGQKVLDGLHWIVLFHVQEFIPIISYYDVSGTHGWRTHLKLKLSDGDKLANKEAKRLNKLLAKGTTKLPIYDAKDLAQRHVNMRFNLNLDVQLNPGDSDIADSVAMGDSFLSHVWPSILHMPKR